MSTQISSLVYVCSSSLAALKTELATLDDADPRTLDARLRQLESTATTLSLSLDKLQKFMSDLPPDDPNSIQQGPQKPQDDGGLLLRAAQRLVEVANDG